MDKKDIAVLVVNMRGFITQMKKAERILSNQAFSSAVKESEACANNMASVLSKYEVSEEDQRAHLEQVMNDHFYPWVATRIVLSDGHLQKVGSPKSDPKECLYPNYLEWCKENGKTPVTMHVFSIRLIYFLDFKERRSFVKRITEKGAHIVGIRLK